MAKLTQAHINFLRKNDKKALKSDAPTLRPDILLSRKFSLDAEVAKELFLEYAINHR